MIQVISPLTQLEDISLLETIPTHQLIEVWKQQLNIDITEELKGYEEIYLYKCNQTQLNFFLPLDIAGSDKLYDQLGKLDWYYMERKWEHDMAIKDISKEHKILEVGCGKGAFIKHLRQENFDAYGIELNLSAVEYAQKHNIPVKPINLYDLANEQPNSCDAVCTFQVLEHISDPKPFLEAMIKLLKPQGKLIISVPNHASFIRESENNIFEAPPHHMTQWMPQTFQSLSFILPIRLQKISYEPLAYYHIDWYISIFKYQHPKFSLKGLTSRIIYQLLEPILKKSPFTRKQIKGHTMYAVFEKINDL
jgi:2-polyprenyl-3-methyl-5-hydroxy-6-metoxy-1,4-benzoquinol methylase